MNEQKEYGIKVELDRLSLGAVIGLLEVYLKQETSPAMILMVCAAHWLWDEEEQAFIDPELGVEYLCTLPKWKLEDTLEEAIRQSDDITGVVFDEYIRRHNEE